MNTSFRFCSLSVFVTGLAPAFFAGNGGGINAAAYGRMPLTFEWRGAETVGQPFVTHVSGHTMAFAPSGAIIERPGPGGSHESEAMLRFVGARPDVQPRAAGPQVGTANYMEGSRPEQWRTSIPRYAKIKYRNLYPGIDLIYYGKQNRLEYDLVVAPDVSWQSIRLAFGGAKNLEVDREGSLRLQAGGAWVTQGRPVVYQSVRSGRSEVFGRYVMRGGHEVGFEIGAHDPNRPLIIDPTLAFASYLGGSGDDYGNAVTIDASGCAYVVGETGSANFPTLGPEQVSMAGDTDVFVTKWNAAGTGLIYSTYIGGSNRDVALGVALDAGGNAYVTGFTYSGDFPITNGALRTSFVGDSKAFVLKLNAAGNGLIYSTFLGGSGDDYGAGIAVNATGEAHIAGYTASIDFPITTGAFQQYYGGGSYDGFLAKLNAAGSALIYATYLGGIANDTAAGVALDPNGNIYVTGQTQSTNFPTVNPVQAIGSESAAFVVKINAAGQVQYSTYLGGTGLNNGTAIAADAAGNAYVTGFTDAPDFPVTSSAYQGINDGSYDAFAAVLNASGSSILSATYLGGSGQDAGYAIALGGSGSIFIAGSTTSIDFPAYAATQPAYNGGGDAFVAEFNDQLSSLVYATYFGGGGNDLAAGVAADFAGNVYITGSTSSGESAIGLPITPGAFQPIGVGGIDAFLAKLAVSGSSLACTTSTPQALNVQAGGALQLVGDLILSCTGGTIKTQVTANIEATLNTPVAGTQPEIFVGSNANPIWGAASGNNAIIFQGISFTAPGPSASITLRITNVWANLSAMAVGGQVIMTVTILNADPSLTVAPTQQTVAIAQNLPTVQLLQLALSTASAPGNCEAPPPVGGFLIGDSAALVWFLVGNVSVGDVAKVDWSAPFGGIYQSHSLTATGGGTQCLWDSMIISGASQPMVGAWSVNIYWNGASLTSAPFVVSTAGTNGLIWQNTATAQVTMHYYSGATDVGWAWLNAAGVPGWKVVGMADMDGNGVPDLIWQNETTRQVTVNYYGGAGGTTYQGWAYLNAAGVLGWSVVGVADMNGDGVPDLIWQNDSTKQVTVNYYGGAGGATYQGWAYLNAAGDPGWTVVGVADFDANGTPDLVWQNLSTQEVTVNYYGGSGGATYLGWAYLNAAGVPGWTVVGAMDFNGDGVPDLIWQNDASQQVTVNYYGGPGGALYQGWAWLSSSGFAGWRALAAN
jgi:hypothetical protein